MKVAIISDIHGNNYALEKVLNAARKDKAEKLLVLGDLVGYYYHPDEVLDILGNWDYELIRGNHEDLLKAMLNNDIAESALSLKYGSGHRIAAEKLSKEQINHITSAPKSRKIDADGVQLSMYHGSPWNHDQYLYPDAPTEILDQCNDEESDFVLIGHSHYPFVYRNTNSTLVNVGSVGQSRIMGGIANWALIDTANKSLQMKATPYETKELLAEVNQIDPDINYLKDILTRNRN